MKKTIRQGVVSLVLLSIVLAGVLLGRPIINNANGTSPIEVKGQTDDPAPGQEKDVANINTQLLNEPELKKAFKKARENANLDAAWKHLTKDGFKPDFSHASAAVFTLTGYTPNEDASEEANQKAEKLLRDGGKLGSFFRVPFSHSGGKEEASILYRTTTEEAFVGVERWKTSKPNKIRVSDVVNRKVLAPAVVTVNEDTTASVEWADGTRTSLAAHRHDSEEKGSAIRPASGACEQYCSLITDYVCHQVCNWVWTTVCNSVCRWLCPIPFICDWACSWVCNAVQAWVCDNVCEPITRWVCVNICPPPPQDPLCLDECGTLDCACGVSSICAHDTCSACGGGGAETIRRH